MVLCSRTVKVVKRLSGTSSNRQLHSTERKVVPPSLKIKSERGAYPGERK
jgi:hypothetical protein